jgi:hypothetical protein
MKTNKINIIPIVFFVLLLLILSIPVIHFSSAIQHERSFKKHFYQIEKNEFGIISDSLISVSSVTSDDESISEILQETGLPADIINKLIREENEILSEFSGGNIYHIFSNIYNPEEILYMVFEKDPVNYVIVNLKDLNISEGQKDLTLKRKSIEGIIKTSFFNSLKGNDIHPELIKKLSEIYQWQIDFHRLKKGDQFPVS